MPQFTRCRETGLPFLCDKWVPPFDGATIKKVQVSNPIQRQVERLRFYTFIFTSTIALMKTAISLAGIFAFALLFLANCQQQPTENQAPAKQTKTSATDLVKRGEYIVNTVGCDDCHTPKIMTPQGPALDMSRRFMGHPANEVFSAADKKKLIQEQHVAVFSPGMTAIAGDWGVSYTANLTPDDTGIGAWTEAQFIKALREGKSKGLDGTRPLLPPMPWFIYRNMNDEDLKAIFAYLKSMPPVKNVVPQPQTL